MSRRVVPSGWTAGAVGMVALITSAAGQVRHDKPRVPPGVDPGGVAIAIIGSGIDYTRPDLAARLARDGEGELIGWDFIDGDRRPWDACATQDPSRPCDILHRTPLYGARDPTRPAGEPAVRLVPMRAATRQPQTLVQAVQAIAQSPARIVVLALDEPPPASFLSEAARRFPHLVLIGVADGVSRAAAGASGAGAASESYIALPASPPEAGSTLGAYGVVVTTALDAARCLARTPAAAANEILACATVGPAPAATPSPR